MDYACIDGIRGGVARCRNLAIDKRLRCTAHYINTSVAPRPDVVLVKVNLNKRWNGLFEEAGIAAFERSRERAVQLGQAHQARAEGLRRDAFVIRERREGQRPDEPEAADSGCPVFGKAGLQFVSIRDVLPELQRAGYLITGVSRLSRDWKPPIRLVLEFSKGMDKPALENFPTGLYQSLVATCFGQVDVWANDRDKRGLVVHTVNCGQRDDQGAALLHLEYAGGDWMARGE